MTLSKAYTGDGCEVAPHCLECPLAVCKYDEPESSVRVVHHFLHDERNALILSAAAQGANRAEIAEAAHMSERSVYRLLQEAK